MRYLPAADGAAAGGDFYDAVELSGGRMGIAVGDIVGHGPGAAAAMGQLRSALRAYALEGRSPARVLQLLSRYADGIPGARGRDARLRGHRPAGARGALRRRRSSAAAAARRRRHAAYLEGARGVPLDRALGHVYVDATAPLPESATLVLYSDGAIERRGGAAGRRAWSGSPARPTPGAAEPEALCTQLLDALADGRTPRDDVALLAARVRRAGGRAAAAVVRGAGRPARGRARGDARRGSPAPAWTAGTRRWSCWRRASCARTRSSTPTATGERRRSRSRSAREPGGVLTLVVRDRGRWRPPAADPGDRGRGLASCAR